jgi:hypothetical protein
MNKTQRVVALLSDRRWHTNSELNEILFRYGETIRRLRVRGYVIHVEEVNRETGLWRYRMVSVPPVAVGRQVRTREQALAIYAQIGPRPREPETQGRLIP